MQLWIILTVREFALQQSERTADGEGITRIPETGTGGRLRNYANGSLTRQDDLNLREWEEESSNKTTREEDCRRSNVSGTGHGRRHVGGEESTLELIDRLNWCDVCSNLISVLLVEEDQEEYGETGSLRSFRAQENMKSFPLNLCFVYLILQHVTHGWTSIFVLVFEESANK